MKPPPTVDMCPDLDTLADLGSADETVRIAVLGMQGVGKSAITVRYLTHRFIGEYKSNTDMMYHQVIKLDGTTIKVDIIDVSTSVQSGALIHHNIRSWAEGFLLVYSVTEPESFQHARQLLEEIRRTGAGLRTAPAGRDSSKSPAGRRKRSATPQRSLGAADAAELPPAPAVLVGNKTDLVHLIKVESTVAKETAARLGCQREEVCASDSDEEITALFHTIIRQCLALKRRRSGMDAIRNAFSSLPRAGRGSAPAPADGTSSLRRRRPRGRLQLPAHGETQLVDIVSPVELRPSAPAAGAAARDSEARTSDGESVCSAATSSGGSSGGGSGGSGLHTPQPGAPARKFSVFDVGRKLGSFISGGSRPATPAPGRFTTSPLKTSVPDLSKASLSEKLDTLKKTVKKVSV